MRHPRLLEWLTLAAVIAAPTCTPLVLCVPDDVEGDDFFSRGDCALTNRDGFRGHEWLTTLANEDLPRGEQFAAREIDEIVEGNRRVDWPKELLVHMVHGVVAYANAATELQDRSENQPLHFLLDEDDDSLEAIDKARAVIRAKTHEALASWTSDRVVALTRIGEACHALQDSFSRAHTIRDDELESAPWCIRQVKAYVTRAPGFELPGDLYHGGRTGDTIGHITSLDSIYRPGRDCRSPGNVNEIESCLTTEARRARLATRDYLAMVGSRIRVGDGDAAAIDLAVDGFFATHVALCP